MMQAKYTSKMEDMILSRYKGNTQNQVRTAKRLFEDFKELFAHESLTGMNPSKIRDKYQTLKKRGKTGGKTYNVDVDVKPAKTLNLKDTIFKAMKESDDMTISIKGTEITVVFK